MANPPNPAAPAVRKERRERLMIFSILACSAMARSPGQGCAIIIANSAVRVKRNLQKSGLLTVRTQMKKMWLALLLVAVIATAVLWFGPAAVERRMNRVRSLPP